MTTTLEREAGPATLFKDYYRLISNVRPQIESSTGNKWVIPDNGEIDHLSGEYEEFRESLTRDFPAYPYMVYLRHHGFPSPLLDWTRSPYIAAHFEEEGIGEGLWRGQGFLAALGMTSGRCEGGGGQDARRDSRRDGGAATVSNLPR